jgi:hypothetical protein
MARFYGEVGYGESVESPPASGIWADIITEFPYFGDVIKNTRKLESVEGLNNNIVVNNLISIVCDQNAIDNFFKIKYVRWAGTLWSVSNVEVKSPRLILTLGGVYNGPTPATPDNSG